MLAPELRTKAEALVDRYPLARSALLPLLHLVQHQDGYITEDGIAECAELLDLTKAEIMAVATFYTMFKREELGTHLVSICTNFSCQVRGAGEVYEAVSERLGVGHNGTTEDGAITLEHAECLGNCEGAPVVSVDYLNYECLDVAGATELVDRLKAGEVPPPTRGFPSPGIRAMSHRLAGLGPHDWTPDALRTSIVCTASTERPATASRAGERDPDEPPATADEREGKRHGPDTEPEAAQSSESEGDGAEREVEEAGTGAADEVEEEGAYSGREAPTADDADSSDTETDESDPRDDAQDAGTTRKRKKGKRRG